VQLAPESRWPYDTLMKQRLVVLVYTRTGWDIKNVTSLLPLSILYLVRPLRRAGFRVVLIDQRIDDDWERKLRELAPEALLVGISAMTGTQIEWGLRAARIVRGSASKTWIVWGGIHPTLVPEQTSAHPLVDIVVRGEGESTLPLLAQALADSSDLRDVPGLTRQDSACFFSTPAASEVDLDEALTPDYDLIKVSDYITTQTLGLRDLAITTSRGCPAQCRYCYNLPYNNRRWRRQSAEAVVEHIKMIVRLFNVQGVLIKDDNFYVDRKRVEHIAEGLRRADIAVAIRGECRADYIARHWEPDFLCFLYDSGFREMTVGAESGDDDMLQNRLNKGITVDDIRQAAERLRQANIATKFTFMAGFPGESEEALRRTIDLMLEITEDNPVVRVTPLHLYAPFPGTPMFDDAVAAGYHAPESLDQWAGVSFHDLDLPWIARRKSRRLERASLSTYFLDRQTVAEYFTGRPLIQTLARIYSGVIRWRCRRKFFALMPEAAIINWYRHRQ